MPPLRKGEAVNCPSKETISKYVDGELSPREMSQVEGHLRTCEVCRSIRRDLEGVGRALKLFSLHREVSPPKERGACPPDDAIAAFADGSIVSPKERMRIARHLAVCDSCARRAGEAAETVRLVEDLEERGLESVPPALTERVRDRLMPRKPVLAGEIAASVKKILKHVRGGLEFDRPEFGYVRAERAHVSESRMSFLFPPSSKKIPDLQPEEALHLEETSVMYSVRIAGPGEGEKKPPGKRKRKRKKPHRKKRRLRKGLDWLFKEAGLRILVRLRGTPAGTIYCAVEISDEAERPLPGVRVALEKADAEPRRSRTGRRGGAGFRDLTPGKYRLVIFHEREVHVNLDLK